MAYFLSGFVLPLLLLIASVINWNLISLVDLIAFLLVQHNVKKIGYRFRWRFLLLWPIIIFSLLVILSQVTFLVIWAFEGNIWSTPEAWWAKLIGLMIVHTWKSPSVIYFLIVQVLVVFVALVDIYGSRFGLVPWQASCWGHFLSVIEHLGLLSSQGCFLFDVAWHSAGCGN